MQSVRARVRNGHLTFDMPTDLPENTEVELLVADTDGLSPAQRRELDHELNEAAAEYRSGGPRYSAEDVLTQLKRLK